MPGWSIRTGVIAGEQPAYAVELTLLFTTEDAAADEDVATLGDHEAVDTLLAPEHQAVRAAWVRHLLDVCLDAPQPAAEVNGVRVDVPAAPQ